MADILILDDDEQILKMAAAMLTREGFETLTVNHGEEALELIRNDPPRLLITDILMPGIDGIEMIGVCAQQFPDLKIIAMSGGRRRISAEFNLKSASMLGAGEALQKPFSREHLVQAVKRQLEVTH